MPASMNIDSAKGKNATGPITKKRFVKLDTTDATGQSVKQCDTLGERGYGIALFSCSVAEAQRGKGVSVITDGRAIVEAGGTVNIGDLVTTDTNGRAVVASAGNFIQGICDENGGLGAGTEISVNIDRAGAKF